MSEQLCDSPLNTVRTLEPQTSDSFGDVHHTLCLEPLQQDADSNKRPSSPAATTVNSMNGITYYVAGLLLCIHACIQHFIVSYLLQLLGRSH